MTENSIYSIFDIETDGLLDEVSLIRCLSYQDYHKGTLSPMKTLTNYDDMIAYFARDVIFVGHKIKTYDIPVVEKILGITCSQHVVDTLGLSWYLYPDRKIHGLEQWGVEVGIAKVKIDDWKGLTLEEYIERCEVDVQINVLIFKQFFSYMNAIYPDFNHMVSMLNYINFKIDCLVTQEKVGIKLDIEKCKEHLIALEPQFQEKYDILSAAMPKSLGKVVKTKPKVFTKKDGSISSYGQKWIDYLEENNLPDTLEEIREQPNPGSDTQLKAWLFQLGWQPITFGLSKATGLKIPKVSLPFGQGICQSVKDLYEVEPQLIELEGYYMIKHRIGVFNSFLDHERNGRVYATAGGFTNTMRLTHSAPVVNLPKPGIFYGKEVREVLLADEGHIMFGSDVSSLEDNTKQHYIYKYDPKYVEEMRVEGFDPHVDIAVLAGLMTVEDAEFLQWSDGRDNLTDDQKKRVKTLKKIRGVAKSANFAATYGAGGPKIAETAKIDLAKGMELHKTYWQRNAAVKKTALACTVKTVNGQKWLYNPISGFWMFLKAEKDRFSTLNQSSGVFVFDSWLRKVTKTLGPSIPVVMQYHDELLGDCKPEEKEYVQNVLHYAMIQTNAEVRLNVKIGVSVDWGTNYAECH